MGEDGLRALGVCLGLCWGDVCLALGGDGRETACTRQGLPRVR